MYVCACMHIHVYLSVNSVFVEDFETSPVGEINKKERKKESYKCLEPVTVLLNCVRQHISVVSGTDYTQGDSRSLCLLVTSQIESSKEGELKWN